MIFGVATPTLYAPIVVIASSTKINKSITFFFLLVKFWSNPFFSHKLWMMVDTHTHF